MNKDRKLVFTCDESGFSSFRPASSETKFNQADSVCVVQREKKGRGGKEVTIIKNVPGGKSDWMFLIRKLKTLLATGGNVKGDSLVLQGDHTKEVIGVLKSMDFKVIRSGN